MTTGRNNLPVVYCFSRLSLCFGARALLTFSVYCPIFAVTVWRMSRLEATLRGDARLVARMVGEAHQENTSIIKYSDENSMACVLAIAYYFARADYIFHREFQTGCGFADLVLIPRKNVTTPAIIVELKYGDTTGTAIDQIKQRQYPAKVSEYSGEMLLVAISYDKKTKEHSCLIETCSKE